MIDLRIKKCDFMDIIGESTRFLSHLLLLHIISYTIDGKEELFNKSFLKTLLFTLLAVVIYNISIKKIVEVKVKKLKKIHCPKLPDSSDVKIK